MFLRAILPLDRAHALPRSGERARRESAHPAWRRSGTGWPRPSSPTRTLPRQPPCWCRPARPTQRSDAPWASARPTLWSVRRSWQAPPAPAPPIPSHPGRRRSRVRPRGIRARPTSASPSARLPLWRATCGRAPAVAGPGDAPRARARSTGHAPAAFPREAGATLGIERPSRAPTAAHSLGACSSHSVKQITRPSRSPMPIRASIASAMDRDDAWLPNAHLAQEPDHGSEVLARLGEPALREAPRTRAPRDCSSRRSGLRVLGPCEPRSRASRADSTPPRSASTSACGNR